MKKEQLNKVSNATLDALADALNKVYGELMDAGETPTYELNALVALANVERDRRKATNQQSEAVEETAE